MERVTGFVQNSFHVTLQADRIHENERHARFRQRGLITARRLALAIIKVEQFQILHLLKTCCEFRVEMIKNFLRARHHFADLRKRF